MSKPICAAIIFAFARVCVCSADELKPPLVPSSAISPDPVPGAGCTLPKQGLVVPAQLAVRNSSRNDVGPYRVTLPGYAKVAADKGEDSYRPFLIRGKPGDTLRIDLANQLDESDPDNIVNLHTHGLIVAPRPYFPCNSLGDYIFDSVGPRYNQSFQYRIDIPETIQGPEAIHALNGRDLIMPSPFPAGLYWFHSHVHGSAKNHVLAAQTGILAIDPPESDPTFAFRSNADERFLVLRDIQLAVPPGQTPDKLVSDSTKSAPIAADNWMSGDSYDTQACRQASNPGVNVLSGLGYCTHPKIYSADSNAPYDSAHDLVWLFTVNGQMGPTITVDPGRRQIWRIANTTATVTYVLDLVDAKGAEQTLHLLTLDGVVSGTPNPTKPGEVHPTVGLKRLLLMPASRAEVLVNNTNEGAADEAYTLRTLGFETGGINQPATGNPNDPWAQHQNYVGDPWPAINLAKVVFKPSVKAASMDELLVQAFARSSQVQRTAEGLAPRPVPAGCVTLPRPDLRRLIILSEAQDSSSFWIGSEVVDRDGKSIDQDGSSAHTIPAVPFEHTAPPFLMRHVCARLGDDEVWEIDNQTNELHNFHIHQTKFRLARPGDRGLPPNFKVGDAIVDPAGVVSSQVPNFGVDGPVKDVDLWHDTIPVPPAQFDPNNNLVAAGKTFVMIPFEDKLQVGQFVFHCHILEHEDKGMMATIEVYDPAHPEKSRQGADAGKFLPSRGPRGRDTAFCGKPPDDDDLTFLNDARERPGFWSRFAAFGRAAAR
jgi:FtsP/CotA-like multicopper oxidase with cupredoxin domain